MNMLADRYALFIVHSMLRLEDGDRLTIHSNEETIEFAHKVAHEAADTTGVPVSLVYIEKGEDSGAHSSSTTCLLDVFLACIFR